VIFGAERKAGLIGLSSFESGDWYQSLRACFEFGDAPLLSYQNFALFDGKTFGVFVFETDNPPYVVGNTKKGGPRDILWRYGSNTNPAGRQELLAMLLPRIADPEMETLKGEIRINRDNLAQRRMEIFVYPAESTESLVIPFHRINVRAIDDTGTVNSLTKISLSPPNQHSLAKLLDSAIALSGASKLQLVAFNENPPTLSHASSFVEIACSFQPAHFSHPVTFSTRLEKREHPDCLGYWEREEQHSVPLHTVADSIAEVKEQLERFPRTRRIPRISGV
jgi:hypothetical protein